MAAIQLGFSLRTSANCKTVHLLGSWDNYSGQLPLSKDAAKPGSWKSNFRFQTSTIQAGKRYWYYYIMDGYHVSHDPAKPSTKEPTTGRQLNILDVAKSGAAAAAPAATKTTKRQSAEIPTGRGISPSRIVAPKPSKPYASRKVREAVDLDEITSQMERAELHDTLAASPALSSAAGSDVSSRASSLSSLSDRSDASSCRCNRYGITRKGDKVLLDCGGKRCGYSDDSSDCCSSSDESESEDEAPVRTARSRAVAARR